MNEETEKLLKNFDRKGLEKSDEELIRSYIEDLDYALGDLREKYEELQIKNDELDEENDNLQHELDILNDRY